MDEPITEADLSPTKSGRGFKILVNGTLLFCWRDELVDVVRKGSKCTFRVIKKDEPKEIVKLPRRIP